MITDGVLPLHESFEEGLTKAKGLRCFAHFQRNCVNNLHSLGINQKAEQRFFIDAVFGQKDKEEGILDAWGKKDLRAILDSTKEDMDRRETETLKKNEGYQSKFWAYLDKNFAVIATNMISKACSKARLPIDDKGKPERCYTYQSESSNNMLTRRKEAFIKTDKGKQDLSNLQFTTEVFQLTYKHQIEELRRLYMAGAMNMNLQTFANN